MATLKEMIERALAEAAKAEATAAEPTLAPDPGISWTSNTASDGRATTCGVSRRASVGADQTPCPMTASGG